MNTTLQHALAYLDRGWHAFVLSPSKLPIGNCSPCRQAHGSPAEMETCGCLTCHGFYAATTDPARITEMLRRHPHGLLAVRTGAPSGIAVVDVDFKDFDGNLPAQDDPGYLTMCQLDAERLLPGTLMQTTGSGGLHFLYAHPGGYLMSGAGKYGSQVDSKADGGYIVVAPSVSRAGPYAWTGDGGFDHPLVPLPKGLVDRVRPPAPAPARTTVLTPWTRPGVARGRLQALVQVVLDSPPKTRNDRLYWASKRIAQMVTEGEIAEPAAVNILIDTGRAIGLTDNEMGNAYHGTIGSGLRNGRLVIA